MLRAMMRAASALLAACAVLACALPTGASDKGLCADAYEEAQRQRSAGKLLLSRAQLLTCQSICPETLVQDCNRWHAEVNALIPRLQVRALDATGRATTAVRVTEAGRLLASRIDEPVELDPGDHELTFELSGEEAVNRRVSVPPGRNLHALTISFKREAQRPVPVQPEPEPEPQHRRGASTGMPGPAIVLGAVGLAGLAAGGVLGVLGHTKRADLVDSCKPDCREDQVDEIRTLWWVGGVSAVVGAAALGGAIVIWQSGTAADVAIRAQPGVHAQMLDLSGRF
jgi:hypothetical protein